MAQNKPQATAQRPNPAPQAAAPTPQVPAKAQTTAVAIPDYIKQGAGRGNEHVQMEDVVIPRIEVAQALSPCLKKSDPEYIEGAEVGSLYNSLTRELYGDKILVCPVIFRKEYLVWKDRLKGGGFRGAHATQQEAQVRILEQPSDEQKDYMVNETGQHLVLVVHDDGRTEEAMVSMSKTKLKISRQWNSLVRINGGDRFARLYLLFTQDDETPKGEFKNFAVQTGGFPDKATYLQAEALYNAVSSGSRKVVMDTSDGGDAGGEEKAPY